MLCVCTGQIFIDSGTILAETVSMDKTRKTILLCNIKNNKINQATFSLRCPSAAILWNWDLKFGRGGLRVRDMPFVTL